MSEGGLAYSRPRYKAGRYHRFHLGGLWHLFAPRPLVAMVAEEADVQILSAAGTAANCSEIIRKAGIDEASGSERVTRLLNKGFLLPIESDEPNVPPVPACSDATFMIGLAQRCNLSCRYCYVNKGAFDFKEPQFSVMDAATADCAVDSAFSVSARFSRYCFHFYGGEPTMNMAVMRRMVSRAKSKGRNADTKVEFAVTTNGTLVTKDIADFFELHHFTVYLSLDGDQRRHDANRRYRNGRGSFQAVWRGLEILREYSHIRLFGSAVISADLPLNEALTLFFRYGIKHAKAERARVAVGDVLSLSGQSYETYLEDIHHLAETYSDALNQGVSQMDTRLVSKILQLFSGQVRTNFCQAGRNVFGISADGGIYPCALFFGRTDYLLGNVRDGLIGEGLDRFRNRFGVRQQEQCADCWASGLCGGGCPAMVDRFGTDDCTVLKAEAESAIAVYSRFIDKDPMRLLGVITPDLVNWVTTGRPPSAV